MNYNDGQKRRAKNRNYEDISRKRSNSQSKEVTQYDFDGSIIAVWKNAYVAEKHGYDRCMINQCCIGNKKSHRGYIWKYTNSIKKQIPKKPVNYDKHYYKCPCCNEDLGIDDDVLFVYDEEPPKFCIKCGQKLNWGSDEE